MRRGALGCCARRSGTQRPGPRAERSGPRVPALPLRLPPPPPGPAPPARAEAEANPQREGGTAESKMAGEEDPGRRWGPFHPLLFPDGSRSPGNRFSQTPPPRPPPRRQARCEQRPRPPPPGSVPCRVPHPARESCPRGCRQAPGSGWLGARGPACVAGCGGDLPPEHTQVTGQPG